MNTTTNRTYKILLIGAGQLGSRYLQGIVKSELNFEIIVVDLSQDSLETAKKRIEEVGNCKKITFTKKLPIDQNFFDICIVSTTANSRRSIVANVYRLFEVKYLILEKVLVQSCNDLEAIKETISVNKKVWVNLPRRLMPLYMSLKIYINDYFD